MERTPLTSGVSAKPVPKIGTETRARVHEEGTCKGLAHVLPWNPPEHVRAPVLNPTQSGNNRPAEAKSDPCHFRLQRHSRLSGECQIKYQYECGQTCNQGSHAATSRMTFASAGKNRQRSRTAKAPDLGRETRPRTP